MTDRRVDAGGCSDLFAVSRSQGACLVTNSELPSAFCLHPYSYAGSFVDVAWAFRLRFHMYVAGVQSRWCRLVGGIVVAVAMTGDCWDLGSGCGARTVC